MVTATPEAILGGMQPPINLGKASTPTLVIGRPHSLFYLAGVGGAAAAPTPGLTGAALTSYSGQIPFSAITGGLERHLARLQAQSSTSGTLILADRLWHNSGLSLTVATAQTINSVAWPARDNNATINGAGVLVGLEVTAATGAGTPSFSMGYTNPSDTAGKTASGLLAGVASSAIGAFYPLGTASGDNGVKSLQTFTLSATWTSGSASLVAYRELARLEINATAPGAIDALTGGFPRFFDNTVPFLIFVPSATAATNLSGNLVFSDLA